MRLTIKNTVGIKLPKEKADYIEFDDDIPGFGIRLRENGSRTWIFQYRIGKKQRRMVLGSAASPQLNLAEIRKTADRLHQRVKIGQDPAIDKETARQEAENTFGVLVDEFLASRKSSWRPRTYEEVSRHLQKYAKPLHHFPIRAVSQRNISDLLDKIATESGDVTANRVRTSLSTLYIWILRKGIRLPEGNVASNTNKRSERSRDRVLADPELKQIWQACRDDDCGAVIRLLMLTGLRARETAELLCK